MAITKIRTNNREEWLAERRKSLGGSDMGAVLGMSPFASPTTVWMDKTGKSPDKEPSEWMRLGTDLEEYVARRFTEKSGLKVINDTATLRNDKYPHLHANIDRKVVGQKAGVECKMISTLNEKKYRNGNFPDNYYTQCVTYLAVSEYDRWYLAVLIYGIGLRIYQMTRIANDVKPEWCESSVYVDDGEIEALTNTGEEFWKNYVETGALPPSDGSKATTDALATIYPESDDTCCDLSSFNSKLILYSNITKEIKKLESHKDDIVNEIKQFMATAGKGENEHFKVSWTSSERKTLDSKRLAQEHPEIDLNEYYKISSSRTFRVTEKGDK
jgi:putative phage-type endonuclease